MSSIVPVAFEVTCVAFDCQPERSTPLSLPLYLRGTRREVEAELRRRSWRPALTRGSWHCPVHAAQAQGICRTKEDS